MLTTTLADVRAVLLLAAMPKDLPQDKADEAGKNICKERKMTWKALCKKLGISNKKPFPLERILEINDLKNIKKTLNIWGINKSKLWKR